MSQGQVPVPPPNSSPTYPEPNGKSHNPAKKGTHLPTFPCIPSHAAAIVCYSIPGPNVGPPSSAMILMDLFTAKMTKYTTTLAIEYSPSSRVPTFEVLPWEFPGAKTSGPEGFFPIPEPLT